VAIAAHSKNPERTMMFLDRVMHDKEFNFLVYYGIEGKHYVITEDNKIGLPEGLTAESNPFPPDKSGFWFTNKDQHLPLESWTPNYIELQSQIKNYLIPGNYSGFTFNDENVKTEVANVAQVATQYENPLRIGAVADVDEAIKTLQEKLDAAGNKRIKAEVERQVAEFLKAREQYLSEKK
jgi:putative aldouronate transport system substrate-binding protein